MSSSNYYQICHSATYTLFRRPRDRGSLRTRGCQSRAFPTSRLKRHRYCIIKIKVLRTGTPARAPCTAVPLGPWNPRFLSLMFGVPTGMHVIRGGYYELESLFTNSRGHPVIPQVGARLFRKKIIHRFNWQGKSSPCSTTYRTVSYYCICYPLLQFTRQGSNAGLL